KAYLFQTKVLCNSGLIMRGIIKFIAAFIAPLALTLFLMIYNVITMAFTKSVTMEFTIKSIGEGLLLIYIYALPFYLIVAVPVSVIIERINKGIRWGNYLVAGLLAGIVIVLLNSNNKSFEAAPLIETIFIYMMAGLAFYFVLKILEFIEQKQQVKL